MDATVNELEHTKISSFPTLTFYPKGDSPKVCFNIYYFVYYSLLMQVFLYIIFKLLILYTITKYCLISYNYEVSNLLIEIFQAIEYNGDRTLEAIIKFIESDGKQEAVPPPSSSSVIDVQYFIKITIQLIMNEKKY